MTDMQAQLDAIDAQERADIEAIKAALRKVADLSTIPQVAYALADRGLPTLACPTTPAFNTALLELLYSGELQLTSDRLLLQKGREDPRDD
jgi:hypothetical protein